MQAPHRFAPAPMFDSEHRCSSHQNGHHQNAGGVATMGGGRRSAIYFGCGTILRYGFGDFQPLGYFCFASSSVTAGRMITSSPCFQFTGVATLCLAVSCMESSTRSTSSKLRPVLMG